MRNLSKILPKLGMLPATLDSEEMNPSTANEVIEWIKARPKSAIEEISTLHSNKWMGMKALRAAEIGYRQKMILEGGECLRCHRKDMLTVDHNIPKYIMQDMGVDVEHDFIPENLVLLCKPCNMLKSERLDFSLPQTKALLLKLLERL